MFYLNEKSGIKYYKSAILDDNGFKHAFTTRIEDNISPLNGFSLGTAGDDKIKPYIEKNRKLICEVLGLDSAKILNPDQKHTDNIRIIKSINDDLSATDGLITNIPGLVLMLLFADCVPIIIYAPKENVIGVIHAGWRGTVKKIAQKAIRIMTDNFNTDPATLKVAIGAAIGKCCYPVSPEIALELQKSILKNCDNIFQYNKSKNEVNVDLKKINQIQLLDVGVVNIDVLDECTSCNKTIFFSYRAEAGKTGRHSAIASLNET